MVKYSFTDIGFRNGKCARFHVNKILNDQIKQFILRIEGVVSLISDNNSDYDFVISKAHLFEWEELKRIIKAVLILFFGEVEEVL